ncbi:hypothetical protein [uncultured Methanomethylovorans sp.]|uniref:beta strand repeat-containing protein n=1 Tax=uncultured Methanomethylovorans sp. TaxID=183759 RepID=UPI002AA85A4A|nr:hypothetical protein [uncultured Methanomethylovorans sp.]
MVYCAFVDTADPGTIDSGTPAKVDSYSSKLVGSGSTEEIQGTLQVSGLDNGDNVIVEIWVVLKSTIPSKTTGNVQTELIDANTATGDSISTGKQTVPLLQVGDFFSSDADISVTKIDSPDPVVQGQQLSYSLVVTNNAIDTVANGIVVTDTLDSNVVFVSASNASAPSVKYSHSGNTVTFNVGSLSPGQSVTLGVVSMVSPTAPTGNDTSINPEAGGTSLLKPFDIYNKVSVTAITDDPTTTNNIYYQPTNVLDAIIPSPALSLIKTATPVTYSAVGDIIGYKYKVTNIGNIALTGPFTVTDDKTTVTVPSLVSLAPGESFEATASYTITQSDLNSGSVTNTAFASNGTVTSNEDNETVTAVQSPGLTLVKTATPVTYSAVGDIIGYKYNVTNIGNIALTGPFTVTDDKTTVTVPSLVSLAPGESFEATASYTITQSDLNSGSVTNTAFASNGTVTSNEDNETVTAVQSPGLTLVKTATPVTYSAVGDIIGYKYNVTNIGNIALTGPFTVTDDKTTVTVPSLVSLAPGESFEATASYTITQSDLNSGSVTNTAFASNGTVTSNEDNETVTAVQSPGLTLVKTATPVTYSAVGDIISYKYNVTNIGNIALTGPFTVTDDKTTVTVPSLVSLAPGESFEATASYTITQSDLNSGSVTNTAFASNGTVTSNEDNETVTAVQSPGLTLVKTATPVTYSAVGDIISYKYNVTNIGNIALAGPFTVTDDKTTVTVPSLVSLAPGESFEATASYTITQSDLNSGSVTNTAFASNGTVTSNEDNETVTAVQSPGLTLVKTATPVTYSAVGDIISYKYNVTNIGNIALTGPFTVTDDKTTVTVPSLVSLAPGESFEATASYTITQSDLNSGSVTNTAFASNGTVTSNEDNETVTAVQSPGLTLVKTATPVTYSAVGDIISYKYNVTNIGNIALTGPFTVTDDKTTVTVPSLVSLAPGESFEATASYTITQSDLNSGSVTNTAFASNGTVTSNEDNETVTAVQSPGLTLVKTATPVTYSAVGDIIGYKYNVTNIGNIALTGPFTVTDDKTTVTVPSLVSLAPGESFEATASYTITQSDLNSGSVTNTAFASNGTVTSNEDNETVTAVQSPGLTLVKTATPVTYSAVGDIISYKYNVTNIGNIALTGPFTVTDDKTTVTVPSLVSLAPGESFEATASYTITQSDLNSGSVTNTAFASNGTVTSNEDNETVTAVQSPGLTLVKTATPVTYSAVGDIISYKYNVTNIGNIALAGPFTVTDDKTTVTVPSLVSLAPGESFEATASYTITQSDLNSGSVTKLHLLQMVLLLLTKIMKP